MKLKKIFHKCNFKIEIINSQNFEVKGIAINSKEIRNNFIFAAIKGENLNGEDYIDGLLNLKNIAIILSKKSSKKINLKKYSQMVFIKVDDVRLISSQISSMIYSNNIKKKFAVTGTNGKTSVASYVHQIWEKENSKSACIGTLGVKFKKKNFANSSLTTPDAINNHKILSQLSKLGCEKVIYEASSIGLDQKRLHPLKFDVIAFTNLSKDHLDYHSNIKNYKISKSLLFKFHSKKNSIAVINTDSQFSEYFLEICREYNIKILDFGKKANYLKIFEIKKFKNFFEVRIIFKNKNLKIKVNCFSEFEIYNRICALIMVFNNKLNYKHFNLINELKNPTGRLEKIYDKHKIKVFIDYAHTPEALSKVLSSLKLTTNGKLFLVFGCGGNRDRSKRHIMTNKAIKYADYIVITNDNPRFEDPEVIINDMIANVKKTELEKIKIIGDRQKAIKFAIEQLSENDLLLIAGKGHENYQIIKNKKIRFSDKLVARKFLMRK